MRLVRDAMLSSLVAGERRPTSAIVLDMLSKHAGRVVDPSTAHRLVIRVIKALLPEGEIFHANAYRSLLADAWKDRAKLDRIDAKERKRMVKK